MKSLIRKNPVETAFAVAAMLAQTPHTAWFFSQMSHLEDQRLVVGHGIFFAILFDVGIVYYVLKANKNVVLLFAMMSVLMNLGYYYAPIIPGPILTVAPFVLSLILPLMIYFFTEEIPRSAHIEVIDNSRMTDAVEMVLSGATYDEVCKKFKVSKSTLTKWVKEMKLGMS